MRVFRIFRRSSGGAAAGFEARLIGGGLRRGITSEALRAAHEDATLIFQRFQRRAYGGPRQAGLSLDLADAEARGAGDDADDPVDRRGALFGGGPAAAAALGDAGGGGGSAGGGLFGARGGRRGLRRAARGGDARRGSRRACPLDPQPSQDESADLIRQIPGELAHELLELGVERLSHGAGA